MNYQELVEEVKLGNNEALKELVNRLSDNIASYVTDRFGFLISQQDVRDDVPYLIHLTMKYFDPQRSPFASYLYLYSIKKYIFEKVRESILIRESQIDYINLVRQIEDLHYNRKFDEIKEVLKDKVYIELNKVNEFLYSYTPKEYLNNGFVEFIDNIVKTQFSKKDQYIFFQYVYEERTFADIASDMHISKQQVSFLYNKHAEYIRYVINQINKNKPFLTYKEFRRSKLPIDKKKRLVKRTKMNN